VRVNLLVEALEAIPPRMRKPEYLFHPGQAIRRLARGAGPDRERVEVVLPWGAPLSIRPDEAIGRAIWRTGTYDVLVSEAVLRLAEHGETAVDVGANIGVMTSAMAVAVSPTGTVLCFEPHPALSVELSENIAKWRAALGWDHVERSDRALSAHPGEAALVVPSEFDANRGTATLCPVAPGEGTATCKFDVVTTTLDLAVGRQATVGVLKVDVEGHELQVLKGASCLLASGRIRDIVFEEYSTYPSPVTDLLEAHGYSVFLLRKGLLGPTLQPPQSGGVQLEWETPNYLATKDPDRAVQRLSAVGWRSLRRTLLRS
jgi:FkbM family methyltransferase